MLIEEMGKIPAFSLTSCDFSDKMLKYALKLRWERRREQAFFDWTIEEGNWMTLNKDVKTPGAGYDAIICMGNSFPHLIDDHGNLWELCGPRRLCRLLQAVRGGRPRLLHPCDREAGVRQPVVEGFWILVIELRFLRVSQFFTFDSIGGATQPRCQEPGHFLPWTAVAEIL